MVIVNPDADVADTKKAHDLASEPGPSDAGAPPPTFEESTRSAPFTFPEDAYVPQGGESPPPNFAPYEAEYFVSGAGDIVSHDRHLNEDGEALYRFLLSHAQTPPTFLLHLRGEHVESRTRWVSRRDKHGNFRSEPEHYTEQVVDFDFLIDVGQHIAAGPIHWSLPDSEPAYRGKMHKEVDERPEGLPNSEEAALVGLQRKSVRRKQAKRATAIRKEKMRRGLPPWAPLENEFADTRNMRVHDDVSTVLKSSRTLRQWADEYCMSNKLLKEFTYEKIVCGWNIANLETAITSAIKSTYYDGNIQVQWQLTNTKIHVRPDNHLSRVLSNGWLKFVVILFCLYPFIWLYERFSSRGGGRWEVCGGAYFLKLWQPVDSFADAPPPFPGTQDTMHTEAGMSRLVGTREGVWFLQWEGTVRRAVTGRLISTTPLLAPDDRPSPAALQLDGYIGNSSRSAPHLVRV